MKNNMKKTISILLIAALFIGILPNEQIANAVQGAVMTSITEHDYPIGNNELEDTAPSQEAALDVSAQNNSPFDNKLLGGISSEPLLPDETTFEVEIPPTFIFGDTFEEPKQTPQAQRDTDGRLSDTADFADGDDSQSSGSRSDPEIPPVQITSAPFSYDYNGSERVNLNTGGLVHEQVDYVLPGINGLDLVIGRRYNSDAAGIYTPTAKFNGWNYYSATDPNEYLNNTHGLGYGWSFMFSSIQDGKYLHLSDGRSFEIEITTNSNSNSNLKDYTLTDIRLVTDSGTYSNGTVVSSHILHHKDGRKEYFSNDGKLIGLRDRFNNTIKFVNTTQNGLPHITITDTLDRTTTISGQTVSGGHIMSISLAG